MISCADRFYHFVLVSASCLSELLNTSVYQSENMQRSDEAADLRMKVLKSSTFLLVGRGCDFFARSRGQRIIRGLFTSWFAIVTVSSACECVERWMTDGLALSSMGFTAMILASISINIALMSRRRACEMLLTLLVDRLRPQELRLLLTSINRLNIFVMVTTVMQPLMWVNRLIRGPASPLMWVSLFARSTPHFAIVTPGVYYIFTKILVLHHEILIKLCYSNSSSDRRRSQSIVSLVKQMVHLSREFDSLLNILPFMWFFYGIIGAPGNIVTMRPSLSLQFSLWSGHIVATFIGPLMAVYFVDRRQMFVNRQIDYLRDWIMERTRDYDSDELLMIYNLESMKGIQLTGLSSFSLDASFILTYVGAVASFTALISSYA